MNNLKLKAITPILFLALLFGSLNICVAQKKLLDNLVKGKKNGMIYAGITSGYNFSNNVESVFCLNYVHKIGQQFNVKETVGKLLNNEKPAFKPFSRFVFEIGPAVGYNYNNNLTVGVNFKTLLHRNVVIGAFRAHVDWLNDVEAPSSYLRYGIEYQLPRFKKVKPRKLNITVNYSRLGILSGADPAVKDNLNASGFLGFGLRYYLRDLKKFNR